RLNEPETAEYLVSHCYEGDLKHKHSEDDGLLQPMCGGCLERLLENPDIHVFSAYRLEPLELESKDDAEDAG
ncbi:MAG: hypothetical protein MK222_02290, partial [Candidatus Poseidoniia archaeon]|nr:hypothetical protein [Candidatus Poseidoniia archaeon]